jgi:hypothetical protein
MDTNNINKLNSDIKSSVINEDIYISKQCIFCYQTTDLYKSSICNCTSVYFCKKCITENQSHSKNCPQCNTPLNLTIGEPEFFVV